MAKSYKLPGVYIEEIPKLPPSVVATASAVPVFIGYTEKEEKDGRSLINIPVRISSIREFTEIYGVAKPHHIAVTTDSTQQLISEVIIDPLQFSLYYVLQLYFANGGGPCYIISCGIWPALINEDDSFTSQSKALYAAAQQKTITITLLPDAALCGKLNFYRLYQQALQQADILQNRIVIVDIYTENKKAAFVNIQEEFRDLIGDDHLKSGAAYYPYLQTSLLPFIDEEKETIMIGQDVYKLRLTGQSTAEELTRSLAHANPELYHSIISFTKKNKIILPPSSAIAGLYCRVDLDKGVWKAPANISLNMVIKPMVLIDDRDQEEMNIHSSGKSVNAIRTFTGKGVLVWGARTLAGNDNEWRYVSVRRFLSWVYESVQLAIQPFVFEPNDAGTWAKVQGMIENYLIILWRQGALQGSKPEQAFYVAVGLNKTMTAPDIQEGRMIIETGIAPLRPSEFIISKFNLRMNKK
jgi:hypothetical protein